MIRIWNYNNGHCLKVLQKEDENEEICDLTYVEMHRNKYIVAVGWDRRINIYTDDMSDSNIHHIQHPIDKWTDDLVCIVTILKCLIVIWLCRATIFFV